MDLVVPLEYSWFSEMCKVINCAYPDLFCVIYLRRHIYSILLLFCFKLWSFLLVHFQILYFSGSKAIVEYLLSITCYLSRNVAFETWIYLSNKQVTQIYTISQADMIRLLLTRFTYPFANSTTIISVKTTRKSSGYYKYYVTSILLAY